MYPSDVLGFAWLLSMEKRGENSFHETLQSKIVKYNYIVSITNI